MLVARRNKWDNSLRYWSLHDNRYLRYFKGHRAEVVGLSVSPKDDLLLSAGADGTCRLWDVRSDACSGFLQLPTKDARPLIAFDDTGIVFAVAATAPSGESAIIKLFATGDHDRGPFQSIKIDNPKAGRAGCMRFSSNGKYLLLAGGSDTCFLVDSFEGQILCEYSSSSLGGCVISDADISPDCRYVLAGTGAADSKQGSNQGTPAASSSSSSLPEWGDSSGGGDGSIVIWPLAAGAPPSTPTQQTNKITSPVFLSSPLPPAPPPPHSGPKGLGNCMKAVCGAEEAGCGDAWGGWKDREVLTLACCIQTHKPPYPPAQTVIHAATHAGPVHALRCNPVAPQGVGGGGE
jgi:WD40 repeat protein